jgi:pimeloyl-ACP methyl ester carboxylesterase
MARASTTGAQAPASQSCSFMADSRMWEPQAAGLAKHFDTIAPDMRGFGDSELPPGPWSPAADVLALMDGLRLRQAPHLVGCSIGGSLAIDFTLEHPERVSKLVLVGAGVGGQTHDDRYKDLYAEVQAAEDAKDMEALNVAEAHLWLDGPGRRPGHVDKRLRDLFLDMNGRTLLTDFDQAPMQKLEPPAIGRLGEIHSPTLVVVGDQDLPPVLETADLLVAKIHGARKMVIHDAAHLPNLEHPERFNRILLDFLNG